MVNRLERLLLVCVVCFVVVLVTIHNCSLSYMHIIIEFDVGSKNHQFCRNKLLECILAANWR